jgi:hypothetical protein
MNKKNQKNSNKKKRSKTISTKRVENSMYHPLYPQDIVRRFRLPGSTQLVTTTLTSFAFTYALGNATSQIPDWTDISNMYDQYVLTDVSIEIMCVTPPTPGTARWFFDGQSAAVPTANDAEDRLGVKITNHSMNANRVWTMKFSVRDFSLLSFRGTTVDYVFGYFKGITNLANFGTTASNTLLYQFRAFYSVVVRGKKG